MGRSRRRQPQSQVEVSYRKQASFSGSKGSRSRLKAERIYQTDGVFNVIFSQHVRGQHLDLEPDTAYERVL